MSYFDYDDFVGRTYTGKQMSKLLAPKDKHIPNKEERKLLRELMRKHKLTEVEVRSHKKYRQQLAMARKSSELPAIKQFKLTIDQICRLFQLRKEYIKVDINEKTYSFIFIKETRPVKATYTLDRLDKYPFEEYSTLTIECKENKKRYKGDIRAGGLLENQIEIKSSSIFKLISNK